MTTLTLPRRRLLGALVTHGGYLIRAEQITVPERGLATRMQGDGLVAWKATSISSRHTCRGQTLHITEAGRGALMLALTNSQEPERG